MENNQDIPVTQSFLSPRLPLNSPLAGITSSMASDTSSPRSSLPKYKFAQACNFCRTKKVRCDGGYPCKQCFDHEEECVFSTGRRARRKTTDGRNQEAISQRFNRLESMINSVFESDHSTGIDYLPSTSTTSATLTDERLVERHADQDQPRSTTQMDPLVSLTKQTGNTVHTSLSADRCPPNSASMSNTLKRKDRRPTGHDTIDISKRRQLCTPNVVTRSSTSPMLTPHSSISMQPTYQASSNSDTAISYDSEVASTQEESSMKCDELSNWEYNGPRCYLSICSQPGISWVTSKVDTPEVKKSIASLKRETTKQLKFEYGDWISSRKQTPEPRGETAWLYTKAFFDNSMEAWVGIVERTNFETKLHAHLSNSTSSDDPSWYAFRNVVFAFGSRIHLCKESSYTKAAKECMELFSNALSVQADMLQCRSSIVAVRAFILMAYFTEGISIPSLYYSLISSAMRLAVSSGLHRQPAPSWKLSHEEICRRNFLFWSIYSLDRQACSRFGRPPTIDDDDISCEIPVFAPFMQPAHVTFNTICIRIAQLSSHTYKRTATARALRQSTEKLVKTVTELADEATRFKLSIKDIISLDESVDLLTPETSPHGIPINCALMIYFLYYGLLFDIHSLLMLPWYSHNCPKKLAPFRSQVQHSCTVVANTARATILGSRLVQLNANTPVLLAIYVPMRAIISLFTHILKDPAQETARSDLVLMDIGAGYASRLEFAMGENQSYSFVRDFARFSRIAVESAGSASRSQNPSMTTEILSLTASDMPNDQQQTHSNDGYYGDAFQGYDPTFAMDLETWSTLIPIEGSTDERYWGLFST